jgi:predicted CxxxxCH...CXXCH cytochrome family protein
MIRRLGQGAAGVSAALVVAAIIWLALAVGGRIARPAQSDVTAPSPQVAVAASPSDEASVGPTAGDPTLSPEPIIEPSASATAEPTAEPTPSATPKPTPKPTRRPTPPPTPDSQPEPTPRYYVVSGSFDSTIANRDMTLRAVHVPVPEWMNGVNCHQNGLDTAGAMEVTVTWAGHTKIPSVAFNIVGAHGEDEIGAVGTDQGEVWHSGEPKVWAYCYSAAKAKTTEFHVDRTGGGSVPTIYKWKLH